MSTTTTATVVNAHALHTALTIGTNGMGKVTASNYLPVELQCAHIHTHPDGDRLVVESTDRFKYMRATVEWDGPDVDAMIHRDDVPALIAALKTPASQKSTDRAEVSFGDTIEVRNGRRAVFAQNHANQYQFPAVHKMMVQAVDQVESPDVEPTRFLSFGNDTLGSMRWLGDLTIIAGAPNKPVLVLIREKKSGEPVGVGLVMPVRLSSEIDVTGVLRELAT